MRKQEKINEINEKYQQNYMINKSGRIYTIFMEKKQWHKFDEIVTTWENHERMKNSNANVKKVCEFIEKNGGEFQCKSMYGSVYYIYKGHKIRVSNHDWTSEKHIEPEINLCSYEKDGHIELIKKLNI